MEYAPNYELMYPKQALTSWDWRWLKMAREVSQWSKDPSTKVGSVVADRKDFISLGYNGFPPDIADTKERLEDREFKYKIIIHAEENALHSALRSLDFCSIYIYPFMPCSACMSKIIRRKVKKVVAPFSDNSRWVESFELTRMLCLEAKVELIEVPEDLVVQKIGTLESPKFV